MTLTVKPTTPTDLPALRDIINAIIATGGTTAHETAMSEAEFQTYYFEDAQIVHTVFAEGRPVGFQALFARDEGVFSVGSFTDQSSPVRGAGAALFAASKDAAKAQGGTLIIAKIRADNVPGLAYYTKMGFVDDHVVPNVPLADGTPMDRVVKHYTL